MTSFDEEGILLSLAVVSAIKRRFLDDVLVCKRCDPLEIRVGSMFPRVFKTLLRPQVKTGLS